MTLSIVEAAAAAQEPLDADALATEGTWAPKNDTDVEWAFEQAGEARAYIASVKAQLADLVNRANARAEAIMAPALNRATYFEGRVAEYAQVNKDKLLVGKKKSREYIGGTIAWRKHPGKLVGDGRSGAPRVAPVPGHQALQGQGVSRHGRAEEDGRGDGRHPRWLQLDRGDRGTDVQEQRPSHADRSPYPEAPVTTAIARTPESNLSNLDTDTLLKLATGNTKGLSQAQKVELIVQVCKVAGLDPRLSPFEYITFQGKEVLYARKNAADQLVNVHKIRVGILSQATEDGIRVVTVAATTADGREQQDIGAVPIKGLQGDALANAMMKAVTKAKRRTILSVCGLSMLDESEVETIPGAKPVHVMPAPPPNNARLMRGVEVMPSGPLDPGVDPPSMDAPPPEEGEEDEELDITSATRVRIQACTSLGQLLVLSNEIKRMPSEVREALREDYKARTAALKESK